MTVKVNLWNLLSQEQRLYASSTPICLLLLIHILLRIRQVNLHTYTVTSRNINRQISPQSIQIPSLRKRQSRRRLGSAHLAVRLDDVALRVDPHAGHGVVEAHVALADGAASPDGLDALAQAVGLDGARGHGGGGDEEDAGLRDEGGEHGAGDDGLDGGDGGVGVALGKEF